MSFLIPSLTNFIDYIFQNSFTGDILFKTRSQYKKNRELYSKYIVMDDKKVIDEVRKLINTNQLKYERDIVRAFYINNDDNSSILDLKERLEGIYMLSKQIFNFFERNNNEGAVFPRTVIKHFEESLLIKKIKKEYLYFLSNIVRAYFGPDIVWYWIKLGEKIDMMWIDPQSENSTEVKIKSDEKENLS